ncbi:MAG: hypothetical protein IJ156_00560 [Bacteroidales bacterium]|nr:hypothetical protein [Bacteroidales bacterium]
MKRTARFLSFLTLLAAVFTGCQREEADYELPGIRIGGPFTVDDATKKASYEASQELNVLNLNITATRDWTADIQWDADEVPWIAVTPDHGVASDVPQSVKVTILENPGFNRSKDIKFSINFDYKTLSVAQTGEKGEEVIGTLDNPYTVAGVIKYVKNLGSDVQSPQGVYVKGIVSQVTEEFSANFGNGTFYISDDGTTDSEQFYAYRVLYLGNRKWTARDAQVKVGDEVWVYGNVVNYKGNTPETVQNSAFVYSHNGNTEGEAPSGGGGEAKGTGTLDDPYNPAGANAAVAGLTWTSNDVYDKTGEVYVKGKISRIATNGTFTEGGTFGNASFYISEDGSSSDEFYAFRILYLGNKKFTSGQTDIKVGDEVVICGKLMNYRGNTPETVAGEAYLYSLNGQGGGGGGGDTPSGGDPAGTGTQADPYNVAAARDAVKNFTWTSNDVYDKTGEVFVKGKISRIADNGTYGQSGTFGNATFYISDDGKEANELYCYRILYLNNQKYTSGTDIKVGDDVVICGELMNYRGNTPETVANKAYLFSLNSSGGGGGGDDTGGASGTGTLADPYNPQAAINAVKDLTWTSNTDYQKTEKVYVKGKISRIANNGTYGQSGDFGNASYYISADGSENGEFYIFRSLYFNGEKYTSGTDIKVGDEVVVYGALMNYRGNTPETVANENWLYSLNGDTGGGGGGGDTPGGNGSGTLADPYNPAGAIDAVKDLTWTSNTDYQKTDKVYVKGKISRIANNGTYGQSGDFGNASYFISADGSENGEFQIFRSLYFNGEKYKEGTDIKVGDEVIVYGALMNYRGNTPETVANESWLYSLNGKTDGGSGGGGGGDTPAAGTEGNPYTVAQALDAVKDLTWTSNSDYQSTDDVYVKGKISRIPAGGTYTEGGDYGNASFYISDDGAESNEFYCFRILYLENKKFAAGQTDIKVGDEVVICGKLMNYRGNTPETVSGKAYLFSLNAGGGGGGGDTPGGGSVSFATNTDAQTWAAASDGTYGAGYGTTTQGLNIAYYKHTSTSNPVAPNANHVRVYKNSVLSVASADGKKIKKIVIGTAPNAGTTSYCFDMAVLEGGSGSATADKSALTVTWSGSASKVVLQTNNGQVRMEKITVEFE